MVEKHDSSSFRLKFKSYPMEYCSRNNIPRHRFLIPDRKRMKKRLGCVSTSNSLFPISFSCYLLQEALEVLRTTSSTVELVVCRLPGEASITPPGAPPPPPARREPPPSLRILNPLPPLQIEPCGVRFFLLLSTICNIFTERKCHWVMRTQTIG